MKELIQILEGFCSAESINLTCSERRAQNSAQALLDTLKSGEEVIVQLNKKEFDFLVSKWKQADKASKFEMQKAKIAMVAVEAIEKGGGMGKLNTIERLAAEYTKKQMPQAELDFQTGQDISKKLYAADLA